jgi:GNAT superfamily N-acetyltransferase
LSDGRVVGPTPVTEVIVRPLEPSDRGSWESLWASYLTFYQRTLAPQVTRFTWERLTDGSDRLHGLLAAGVDGSVVGFAHYLFHESTWCRGGKCYLEDLYVAPEARAQRVGRALIEAVRDAARRRSAEVLYWHTEEFNATARRLYERVAKRSPFIRYDVGL